jgi:hypothetical protein
VGLTSHTLVMPSTVCAIFASPVFEFILRFLGCWITPQYPEERIALEYLWVWLTAFTNIIIYGTVSIAEENVYH